jgi:hypothetical protein
VESSGRVTVAVNGEGNVTVGWMVFWAMGVGVSCNRPEQATSKKRIGSSRMGLQQRSWEIADMTVVIVNLK